VIRPQDIKDILDDILKQKEILLVDLVIPRPDKVLVYIDRHDRGVTVDDCAEVSRAVEARLDTGESGIEIEVSSPGPERSLNLPQQFEKNIGRDVYITTSEGKNYSGRLSSKNGNVIVVEDEKRMKDEKTGKKVPVIIRNEILIENIKKAKIVFSK